jgi:hypothetical protein
MPRSSPSGAWCAYLKSVPLPIFAEGACRVTNVRTDMSRVLARIAAVLLLSTALGAQAAVAYAYTVSATFEELAASSDAVVIAKVASLSYRQLPAEEPGARGAIVTDADLSIERAIKGSRPATLRLTVSGGEAGGLVMVSSESPRLVVGERLLLFLDAEGRISGGRQGALEVVGADVPGAGMTLAALEAQITGIPIASNLWTQGLSSALSSSISIAGPVISDISPDGQPAGTISLVTITGSGFGPGMGMVRFPGPKSLLMAPLVSWTDTQVVCVVPMVASGGSRSAASSGPVMLTTAAGASTAHNYRVGFAYAGTKWNTGSPPYTLAGAVTYKLNESSAPLGVRSIALARAQAGAAAWNAVAPDYFEFAVDRGGTETDPREHSDGSNDIFWSTSAGGSGVLAENRYWYYQDGPIFESDIIFYPPAGQWGNGTGDTYDIATVAAHEMGHAVALLDQYGDPGDRGKLMFWQTTPGATPLLSEDDKAGLRYAYDPTYVLPGEHLDVSPVITPIATAITITSTAYRIRYPRYFVLSGVLRPGYAGDPVVAEVRKPGSARWSYSSARICYGAVSSGGTNWWYRYTPKLRGTYYFRTRYQGSADRYGSLSRTISVRVVR